MPSESESTHFSCSSSLSSTFLLKPNEIAKIFHPADDILIDNIAKPIKNKYNDRSEKKSWTSINSNIPFINCSNFIKVGRDYNEMRMKRDDLRSEVTNKFSKSHSNAMDYSGTMYLEREVGGSNESETSSVQSNLSQIIKDANRRNKRMVYSNCSDEALMDIHKSCRKPHIKRDKCALHPDRSGEHPDRCKDFNHPIGEHSRLCVNKEIHLSAKYVNIHEDQMQHKLFANKEDNGKGDYFHEMNLSKLGFYSDIIKWDNLKAPDRRELHPIIHERLCSFINPDIILLIDEHEFYCHRIVLQCYSTYFDELNNLEAKNYLKLDKEVTKDAFIAIYAWMLTTGQGGFHYLTRENILQVLIACHHLKVTDLEEQCLAFIDNENAFSEENAFHLFVDASRLKHKAIMELMVPRIKAFFLHLVSSKEFLELSLEDLCIFLQSNYAIVHCEMEMFMSAVRWLMYRWDDRCNYMTNVMRCVRFGLMTPSQLVDIRKNPESPEFLKVTQDKFVQKLIDDGMAYSVENSLSGAKSDHTHRCNLLKLDVPEPRNFSKETKDYKTYSEFLKFLQDLHKNPRYMYVANNCEPTVHVDLFPDSPRRSQDSIFTDHENEMFIDDGSTKRNKSVPIFQVYNKEKVTFEKECEIKNVQQSYYGQNIFHESTDNFSKRINKPSGYQEQQQESYKNIDYRGDNGATQNDNFFKKKMNCNELIFDDKVKLKHVNDKVTSSNFPDNSLSVYYNGEKSVVNRSEHFIRKLPVKSESRKLSLKESAAIIIQSTFRGYRVRKMMCQKHKRNLMEDNLKRRFNEYNRDVNQISVCLTKESKSRFKTLTLPSVASARLRRARSSDSNLASSSDKPNYDIPGTLYFPHHPSILIFGGKSPGCKLSSLNNCCTIYRYIPDGNCWETVGFLPKPRYHHATTMLKGKVYVIGGSNPMEIENNVYNENWTFDPLKRQWSKDESKLLRPRKSFGLVTFYGYMYVIGGQDKDNNVLSSVERYDANQKKWEEVTPLPEPLIYPAVCVFHNQIWVAGGLCSYSKPVVSSNVYCYDPCKNLWLKSTPLRFGRGFSSLINYEDSLHLIGGAFVKNDELISVDSIDVWDDKQKKWKLKANMAIPRHGHVVAILGSQMLMIGGTTTKYVRSLNQIDVWCMKTGTWNRQVTSLPVPVVGHSIVALPPTTHI